MATPYRPEEPQTRLDMDKVPLGSNFCYCPSCGEFFSGAAGFDHHRAGEHAAGTRHCVNPAEVGMKIVKHRLGTLWVSAEVPEDHYQKLARQADHARSARDAKRKEAA